MRLAHLFLSLEKDDIFIHLPSSAKSNLQRSCYINHGAAHRLPELNGINYSFTACVVHLLRYDTCKSPLIVSRKIVKLYSHRTAGRQHMMCHVYSRHLLCACISLISLSGSRRHRDRKKRSACEEIYRWGQDSNFLGLNLWCEIYGPPAPTKRLIRKNLALAKLGQILINLSFLPSRRDGAVIIFKLISSAVCTTRRTQSQLIWLLCVYA